MHIVLAGDSIFDNNPYVGFGEPDVIQQLKTLLKNNDKATLLALDGSVTASIHGQLENMPEDATHLFLSVGGNDALSMLNSLLEPVSSIGEGLLKFNFIREDFEKKYSEMLFQALKVGLPTCVCTIYHPRFDGNNLERISEFMPKIITPSDFQKIAMNGLSIFNDIIFQEAVKSCVPVVDLRVIFNEERDYANPIEPSMFGGRKMVKVIQQIVYEHDFSSNNSVVYS